jgi:hypothetical protein
MATLDIRNAFGYVRWDHALKVALVHAPRLAPALATLWASGQTIVYAQSDVAVWCGLPPGAASSKVAWRRTPCAASSSATPSSARTLLAPYGSKQGGNTGCTWTTSPSKWRVRPSSTYVHPFCDI